MNYHTDQWINQCVLDHYADLKRLVPQNNIVGIFYQGSGNYGLDYVASDVDTRAIILPSLNDIARGFSPQSTTYVRHNEEHIDIKDIRLMTKLWCKQNLQFIEILFTKFFQINPTYSLIWYDDICRNREHIARCNPVAFVKACRGMAAEKYHAMEHRYPSKAALIDKYGYDGKQLHHIVRIQYLLEAYFNDMAFDCIFEDSVQDNEFLMDLKLNKFSLEVARDIAEESLLKIDKLTKPFIEKYTGDATIINTDIMDYLEEDVVPKLIKTALKREIMEEQ